MSTTKQRRIAAHYIYTPQGLRKNGVITVDPKGKIVAIDIEENVDSCENTEFFPGILIPGMVNLHSHLELSYLKGTVKEKTGFVGFAKTISQHRNKFSKQQKMEAAEYQDAKMWADGVQAVGDVCNSDITLEIKKNSKIFYHSFVEIFGLRTDSSQNAQEIKKKALEMGLSATTTPHSAYSVNNKMFEEAVGDDDNKLLSIHFMESVSEAELYQNRGALREWYTEEGMSVDFTARYGSPLHRIVQNVPMERELISVHNTHISESDLQMLKQQYGDKLTLVLCLKSNKYIADERPPMELIKNSGVRIAVGTDSLASNHLLSIVDELKGFKEFSLEEQLHIATLAGAQALGIDKEMGSLEIGKTPGIVLLSNLDMTKMRLTKESQTKRII